MLFMLSPRSHRHICEQPGTSATLAGCLPDRARPNRAETIVTNASIMERESRPEAAPLHQRAAHWLGARPLRTSLSVLLAVTAFRSVGTVDSDVSWQLWIAHQLNGGATLYRDIIEVNPPLWFWMAMPVERLAHLLHVRADHAMIVAMGCATALSLAATNRLTKSIDAVKRTLLLCYAALILSVMPWMQAGQREQIVLICTLPYAALAALRAANRPVPRGLSVAVGAGAALGFALKHYFLLAPALLEFWLLARQRGGWRPFRPETFVLVAVGAAYALAVMIWARAFVEQIVPLASLAYAVSGAPRALDLFQPGVVVGSVILLATAAQRSLAHERDAELAGSLLITGFSFLIAYCAQAKGWAYHALPSLGCAAMALAPQLLCGRVSRPLALAAPALLALPLAIGVQTALQETAPSADLRHAVAGLRSGDSVGFLATDPAFAWSVTLQRGLAYPSRYMGFWMMRAIVRSEALGSNDPQLTALGRQVVAETVRDFRCLPPRRIVVARPRPGHAAGEFDILDFFLRDREFADLFSHYRPVERTTVDVYERRTPLRPVAGGCIIRAP